MTNHLDTRSTGDRRRMRTFGIEFWIGIAAYVVLLAVAVTAGQAAPPSLRLLLTLLPVLPTVWVAVAVIRHLRRIDEYQRLRTLEGLGVGFVVAMLTAVTIGLLDPAGFTVPASEWWIYSAGMLAWLVTALVQRLR